MLYRKLLLIHDVAIVIGNFLWRRWKHILQVWILYFCYYYAVSWMRSLRNVFRYLNRSLTSHMNDKNQNMRLWQLAALWMHHLIKIRNCVSSSNFFIQYTIYFQLIDSTETYLQRTFENTNLVFSYWLAI